MIVKSETRRAQMSTRDTTRVIGMPSGLDTAYLVRLVCQSTPPTALDLAVRITLHLAPGCRFLGTHPAAASRT